MIYRLLSRLPRSVLLLSLLPSLLVAGASGAHPAYATTVATIVNEDDFPNFCLSMENVGPVIDSCDGTQRQLWKLVNVPNHARDNLIRSDLTGDCLSIKNNNRSEGALVNSFKCDFTGGNPFELWFPIDEVTGVNNILFTEIANEGDGGLVMHPSGCMVSSELSIFMNDPLQCHADNWDLS